MIKIKNLSKTFDKNKIIDNFDINFEKDKTSVILGPSGCGKSTLFNILSKLDDDYSGEILMEDNLSYIFQEDRLIPWLSVVENLKFINKDIKEDKINKILDKFHLIHKKTSQAKNLSGGEKQRLSIARAFLAESKIILIDEALGSMDLSLKLEIIQRINKLVEEENKTIVAISHDVKEALLLADTIYILDKNPMKIVKKLDITIDKSKRDILGEDIRDLEKEVLSYLL